MAMIIISMLLIQGPAGPAESVTLGPPASNGGPTASVSAPVPTVVRPLGTLSDDQIRWINRRSSGVGVGFDNGVWGDTYGQSLKLSIPFGRKVGRFFGLRIRGVVSYPNNAAANPPETVISVGGELFGRSPVWWGVLRVYGGGGVLAGFRPNRMAAGVQVGGDGFFGLEAFATPFMAFTFEVGAQVQVPDSGGSVMGGLTFYFGRTEIRWKNTR